MELFKKYLKDQFQFSEAEWDSIKPYTEQCFLRKQEYFVKTGVVCRALAFVEKGVLRFCMERGEEDITCYFIFENGFVGDPDSFFTRKPSDKNLQALTDCELTKISRSNMDAMFLACPRFKEILGLIDHDVMMGLMMQRDFLQHADAEEKYRKFMEKYPHILQRVPLAYVASFLGITQQSLSRLRRQIS